MFARANGVCEYCRHQAAFSSQPFAIEHIIPFAIGGETSSNNLALACQGCNNHKHTKTTATDPISRQTVPLFHPRLHDWSDHFAWNEDKTRISGRTPIGRATVETLHLNRAGLVALRQALVAANAHPP